MCVCLCARRRKSILIRHEFYLFFYSQPPTCECIRRRCRCRGRRRSWTRWAAATTSLSRPATSITTIITTSTSSTQSAARWVLSSFFRARARDTEKTTRREYFYIYRALEWKCIYFLVPDDTSYRMYTCITYISWRELHSDIYICISDLYLSRVLWRACHT